MKKGEQQSTSGSFPKKEPEYMNFPRRPSIGKESDYANLSETQSTTSRSRKTSTSSLGEPSYASEESNYMNFRRSVVAPQKPTVPQKPKILTQKPTVPTQKPRSGSLSSIELELDDGGIFSDLIKSMKSRNRVITPYNLWSKGNAYGTMFSDMAAKKGLQIALDFDDTVTSVHTNNSIAVRDIETARYLREECTKRGLPFSSLMFSPIVGKSVVEKLKERAGPDKSLMVYLHYSAQNDSDLNSRAFSALQGETSSEESIRKMGIAIKLADTLSECYEEMPDSMKNLAGCQFASVAGVLSGASASEKLMFCSRADSEVAKFILESLSQDSISLISERNDKESENFKLLINNLERIRNIPFCGGKEMRDLQKKFGIKAKSDQDEHCENLSKAEATQMFANKILNSDEPIILFDDSVSERGKCLINAKSSTKLGRRQLDDLRANPKRLMEARLNGLFVGEDQIVDQFPHNKLQMVTPECRGEVGGCFIDLVFQAGVELDRLRYGIEDNKSLSAEQKLAITDEILPNLALLKSEVGPSIVSLDVSCEDKNIQKQTSLNGKGFDKDTLITCRKPGERGGLRETNSDMNRVAIIGNKKLLAAEDEERSQVRSRIEEVLKDCKQIIDKKPLNVTGLIENYKFSPLPVEVERRASGVLSPSSSLGSDVVSSTLSAKGFSGLGASKSDKEEFMAKKSKGLGVCRSAKTEKEEKTKKKGLKGFFSR